MGIEDIEQAAEEIATESPGVRLGDSFIPFIDARPIFYARDLDRVDAAHSDLLREIPQDPDSPLFPIRFYMGDTDEHIDVPLDATTFRRMVGLLGDRVGEWAGIPVPLDHTRIRVEDRYPWKGIEYVGGPQPRPRSCTSEESDETVHFRNTWYSAARRAYVTIFSQQGRIQKLLEPRREYVRRMNFWLNTAGASAAWDMEAEYAAQEKLRSLLKPHLFEMYFLTGSFLESSPHSRVTYLFRRLRPTLAMVPADRTKPPDEDRMKVIAALCLHPIGYYEQTWAGAMCPTDDVLAHLLHVRADEHGFWRRANQHDPESAEAGI